MFNKLFGKKKEKETTIVVVNLNAKLQPMDRGEYFEDPIDEKIQELGIGSVVGGGTLQSKTGEIENCDIEIEFSDPANSESIKSILTNFDIPKGSKITFESTGNTFEIGTTEGLGLYLNGSDLPSDVYQNSDVNFVVEQINQLLDGKGSMLSHWEGATETALYFYGASFNEMKQLMSEFVNSYPLCEKCRIVQIA